MQCQTCKFNHICSGRIDESVGEHCKRYKSVEHTNDDWRKTCSAEEFAEWFVGTRTYECEGCPAFNVCDGTVKCKTRILDWLKEKHEDA